jgi:Leucine-rich repeat (LRR) protein
MSFNRIQIIEKNVFIKRGYAALEMLDMSNNNISDINPYAFTGLDTTKKLILGHNNLLSLQQNVFEPLMNLKDSTC